uniref:mt-LAF20 n=1 Tax=Trypanosoma brucei brucei TaxID=5702 RepID=UPI00178D076B|nr:Chain EU, mt-LAF20 [Trypanosoma brucei brucei]
MFTPSLALWSQFLKRTFVGGMGYNVKRPYRIEIRMEHDKKRRMRRRNIGCRRMMKS